jgi:hypothetical protein
MKKKSKGEPNIEVMSSFPNLEPEHPPKPMPFYHHVDERERRHSLILFFKKLFFRTFD